MFACEISLILLCIFETIYAVLLLWVGHVVVHLCDHNSQNDVSFDLDLSGPLDINAYNNLPPSHAPLPPPPPPVPVSTTPAPPPRSALLVALDDAPSIRKISTIKSAETILDPCTSVTHLHENNIL